MHNDGNQYSGENSHLMQV